MTAVVLRGDARRLPLPDGSVDLICCSPPYFGLRSYTDTCRICLDIRMNGLEPAETIVDYDAHVRRSHHYDGQIGSEATPAEWVAALVACTAEWVRVLKPSGSIFVNLGDRFAGGGGQWENDERPDPHRRRAVTGKIATHGNTYGMRPKSLLGLPWRYALACMDELGLILRRDIIWSKPNSLPESVQDRCRSSHEYLFHFTVQPRYYAAVDEIREPHSPHTVRYYPPGGSGQPRGGKQGAKRDAGVWHGDAGGTGMTSSNPLGKLPGSVWEIASQPLSVPAHLGVDHFAAFPMELPRRVILGWSPPGVCTVCGEGRRPVVDKGGPDPALLARRGLTAGRWHEDDGPRGHMARYNISGAEAQRTNIPATITGYACACPQPDAPTRPALVVDPFGGTGTTALVASMYGRLGVSVDLSGDYCRLADWRIKDPAERAKALQVPKPPPVPNGQGTLFEDDVPA